MDVISIVLQVIPEVVLDDLLKACHSNSYEKLESGVKDMMAEGHSGAQFINQLHDRMLKEMYLTDKQRSAIFERIAVSFIFMTRVLARN